MKAILLLPAGLALLATGVAVGFHVATSPDQPETAPPTAAEAEVAVRSASGELRTLTAAEAAERIERLEQTLARRRIRGEGADVPESAPAPPPQSDPPIPRLTHTDGKPYSVAEIEDIARSSTDTGLRQVAIQALRREDSDEARATLQAILADKTTPAALREEAAKALASRPDRDKLPEELVTALREETDPAVRRALAQGVGQMRDREAWMTDIVALVHDEKDPEVRKSLFEAMVRDARDPVARAELLGIATNVASSPDERRAALAALPRGRGDAETIAKIAALLTDPDPRIRENAVAYVGEAKAISTEALAAALADADPGVRRAALGQGLQRLPQFANDKAVAKSDYQQLVDTAVRVAGSDPDPSVRRAAIQQVNNLPKALRDQVLQTGRSDPDLFVQLTAYARSPDPVARQGTSLFVSALDSPDAGVRDFAYRQLQRVNGVTAPFDARWNAKARAAAIGAIRQDLSTSGR